MHHLLISLRNSLFIVFCCSDIAFSQVVEVIPVFPKLNDDVTIIFNATQGNGALTSVSPVYAHTGVITSESSNPSDWKYVQGVWGTPDANVLMTSLGNNQHSISYNIKEYYGIPEGETVESLAFVFRNANGSLVGRASDGGDIFYPVYPDDIAFQTLILAPQDVSLAVFLSSVIPFKGATSQDADQYLFDNGSPLAQSFGSLLEYDLTASQPGNHEVEFRAIRGNDTLRQFFFYSVIEDVVIENPFSGSVDGLTIYDDNKCYFQLYAPGKSFVHLNGDMSDWNLRSDFQMKRSVDGTTWWIEIEGLEEGENYSYQYVVDGTIRIADPYSTLVLDPFNDGAITEETYPNMPQYPYGLTSGMVSNFVVDPGYPVTSPLSPKPQKTDLIIYELLMRDFLHAHSYTALMDTLDYLQRLGVNAIELMPVQEFEGNLGWGYNPSYHMALDKYYGSPETFRALIEECHARGIAVILDVVYNHAFGQSPLAQLYWDAAQNRPSLDNPWLNPTAKHDFNVGYDFNHESDQTKKFVKRVISWWMESFGIDGFRLDLSKGFTQNNTLGNINAWGMYDQSRIDILQEYADHIWSIDPEAYVILEHFADNAEEIELSSRGMMLWGNMTGAYGQGSMGYGGSDLSRTWHVQRGWAEPHLIGYMESHDEERLMYKNLTNGNMAPGYNIKDLNVALSRIELVSTFFYLIPGPKMIWEFGELGYDYSINYCPADGSVNNNCRLEPKPIRWDYKDIFRRQRIYDIDRALIQLRQQTAFKEGDLQISLISQFEKKLHYRHTEMDIVVVGNFHVGNRDITPAFTKTGWWYDYLTGDSLQVTDVNMIIPYTPGEYHVYTTKNIPIDFEITTSIADIQISTQPLEIIPSLNNGSFDILLPTESTGDADVYIWNSIGHKVDFNVMSSADRMHVDVKHAMPGIYIVNVIQGSSMFTGRMVVN